MSSLDERPFPTAALLGAGLLVATTVVGVGALQLSKHYAPAQAVAAGPEAVALETRSLRFLDQGDGVNSYGGHVRVFDARTGVELPALRDSDGFIRAVLNSLNFERVKRSIDGPPIFEVARWPDGRMTMSDPVTRKSVNVGAFGGGNRSVFLRFFEPGTGRS